MTLSRALGLLAVASSLALAVGCGDEGDGGDGGAPPPDGTRRPPRNLAPVPWARFETARGGRALRFVVENDPCHLPVRAAGVEESDDRVVVTLYGPRVPRDAVCIQVLRVDCAEVALERPLGERKVVDGASRPRLREGRSGETRAPKRCRRVRRL